VIEGSTNPSPLAGEGGARSAKAEWEGEGAFATHAILLQRAKWMRAHPTEAERRLWSILRDRRLATYKFKRQQIIFPYIVDFVCLSERLIIEADGSQHADNKDDARRDAFLRRAGFRVLRFWNSEVLEKSSVVPDAIFAALLAPHPPTACGGGPLPLPQGEKGR
jgi:very-short-patch-repair endonuclease